MHRKNGLADRIAWFVGRFKLLTGVAALGIAGAILAISGGDRAANRNPEVAMRLVPLIMAAFTMLFLTSQRDTTSLHEKNAISRRNAPHEFQ